MDKYDLLQQIGDGTFGSVAKAVHKKSGQLVAVKRMKQKYYSWEECVNLPEVQVLRKLQAHPNVIKLREVVRENNELFFVFEFMDGDLLGVIRKCKQSLPPAQALTAPAVAYTKVKSYMFQLMQALAFLHKSGYFHRDLKPENLLIRKDAMQSQEIVKLADFGLVKEVRARPPYTDYVSTRWYRAPELLLQDRNYTCAVDVWAAGCIFSELMTTKPLFPGNNEVDQLFKIMSVFGSPTEATWADGIQLARKIRYQFPMIAPTPLRGVLPPHVPPAALDLLSKMLVYDPKKRMTAQQCLTHPYFNVGLDEEPLTAYCASTVSRPQGGAQSAPVVPNPNPMQTPVQWRQAAEKESANSANKAPAFGGQVVQPPANPNRPASGNRPMFPPVEISKHVITNNNGSHYQQQQGSSQYNHHANSATGNNDGNLSRYYLVPSGLSPKQREAMQPGYNGNNNYGSSSNVASPVPSKQAMEGLTPPQRPPTKLEGSALQKQNAAPTNAQQPRKPTTNKAVHSVDLDQLMDDFEHEMSVMGFHTRKEGVAPPAQQSSKSGAVTHPTQHRASPALNRKSPQLPTPVSSNKIPQGSATPTSNVGFKGLPQPLSTAYNSGTDDLSPIQKLLNNARYKPSHASSGGNAPGGSFAMPAHLAGTPTFPSTGATQLPPQLNANSVHSPSAATAANRYDLDSASFASLDVGAMSLAGSTGGKKAVLGNTTISPSVNTLLSRQSFKPAPLPTTQVDDSDLPSWLRMVNDKTKRSTPTEFGKVLPLAGSRR